MSKRDWQVLRAIQSAMVVTVPSMVMLGLMGLATWTANAQGVGDIQGASDKLADVAAKDVTRLAMQVAIVLALINAAMVAAMFKLAVKAVAKPCLMHRDDGVAVMQAAVDRAVEAKTRRG
jgi:hypothetical protein